MVLTELRAAKGMGEMMQTHPLTPPVREGSSWRAAIERSEALPITGELGEGLFCPFHNLLTDPIDTTYGGDHPDVIADTNLTVGTRVAIKSEM